MSLEQAQKPPLEQQPLTVKQALAEAQQAFKNISVPENPSEPEHVMAALDIYARRLYWQALAHTANTNDMIEAKGNLPLQEEHIRRAERYIANQGIDVRMRQVEDLANEFGCKISHAYRMMKAIGTTAREVADDELAKKFLTLKDLCDVDVRFRPRTLGLQLSEYGSMYLQAIRMEKGQDVAKYSLARLHDYLQQTVDMEGNSAHDQKMMEQIAFGITCGLEYVDRIRTVMPKSSTVEQWEKCAWQFPERHLLALWHSVQAQHKVQFVIPAFRVKITAMSALNALKDDGVIEVMIDE